MGRITKIACAAAISAASVLTLSSQAEAAQVNPSTVKPHTVAPLCAEAYVKDSGPLTITVEVDNTCPYTIRVKTWISSGINSECVSIESQHYAILKDSGFFPTFDHLENC